MTSYTPMRWNVHMYSYLMKNLTGVLQLPFFSLLYKTITHTYLIAVVSQTINILALNFLAHGVGGFSVTKKEDIITSILVNINMENHTIRNIKSLP